MTLKDQILELLDSEPGLTDREITDRLKGPDSPQQSVNQACRQLYHAGRIIRREGDDGLLRNWRRLDVTEGVQPSRQELLRAPRVDGLKARTDGLSRLEAGGFKCVGDWAVNGQQLTFRLNDFADKRNVLYAFVIDGNVCYVGKTTMPLQKRLYGYQNPGPKQSTNIKNHQKIHEMLTDGRCVAIYALPDSGLMQYAGFHLNLAAGLEDGIIAEFRPDWNG